MLNYIKESKKIPVFNSIMRLYVVSLNINLKNKKSSSYLC